MRECEYLKIDVFLNSHLAAYGRELLLVALDAAVLVTGAVYYFLALAALGD